MSGIAGLVLACAGAAAASTPMSGAMMMPKCSAGDPVVWVNTSSKIYYTKGQTYYGKTAHGTYACKSKAAAMGARMTKSSMGAMGGGAMGGSSMGGSTGGAMSHGAMGGMSTAAPSPHGALAAPGDQPVTTPQSSNPTSMPVVPGPAGAGGSQPVNGNVPNNPASTPNPHPTNT